MSSVSATRAQEEEGHAVINASRVLSLAHCGSEVLLRWGVLLLWGVLLPPSMQGASQLQLTTWLSDLKREQDVHTAVTA